MIFACNVMLTIGTGMENVTHLKNRTLFRYVAFKCGPASEPLDAIKTLSPDREKLYWELTSNSVM